MVSTAIDFYFFYKLAIKLLLHCDKSLCSGCYGPGRGVLGAKAIYLRIYKEADAFLVSAIEENKWARTFILKHIRMWQT